ncbi:MAG TPA: hypothetical protein VN457_01360, partial [Chlamydiales bacterium]|nr:hypothetical protein [Chlamydiales bacterium]
CFFMEQISDFISEPSRFTSAGSQEAAMAEAMSRLRLEQIVDKTNVPYIKTILHNAVADTYPIKKPADFIALSNLIVLVYKVAKRAIEDMQKQKYDEFDPLVFDCACQMRALFVAKYARRYAGDEAMQKENTTTLNSIDAQIKAIEKFQATIELKKSLPVMTFKAFIDQNKMDIEVTQDIVTLARCVLLCGSKKILEKSGKPVACSDCGATVDGYKEETKPAYVETFFNQKGATKSLIDKVMWFSKVALAQTSCDFIMKEAAALPEGVLDDLTVNLLQEKNVRVIEERKELPALATLMVLFQTCRYEKSPIPVLLKVRRAAHTVSRLDDPYDVQLLLKPTARGESFIAVKPTKEDMNMPLIVVEGQRCGKAIKNETAAQYVRRLCGCNFMSLIKGFGATLKQYSKQDATIPSFEKMKKGEDPLLDEFTELQLNAKKAGCSHADQSLISFTHIYCDTLSNLKAVITE